MDEQEALKRKYALSRTNYYKKQPFYYVSRCEKLKAAYQKEPLPETKQEIEELVREIETVCPYGEAVFQWKKAKEEMDQCRGALKDNKKELQIVEDTFRLFHQMEPTMPGREDREIVRENFKAEEFKTDNSGDELIFRRERTGKMEQKQTETKKPKSARSKKKRTYRPPAGAQGGQSNQTPDKTIARNDQRIPLSGETRAPDNQKNQRLDERGVPNASINRPSISEEKRDERVNTNPNTYQEQSPDYQNAKNDKPDQRQVLQQEPMQESMPQQEPMSEQREIQAQARKTELGQSLEQDLQKQWKCPEPRKDLTVTQINLERREVSDDRAKKMLREYLQYAPYLESDSSYIHHVEQLYLMCREGMGKEFIEGLFCYGREMDLVSLDLLRCLALVCDESFAMEFFDGDFSLSEVKEAFADHAARQKYSQFGEVEKIRTEAERLQERFDIQMDFLKKEQENSKAYADELINSERRMAKERLEQQKTYYEDKIKSMKVTTDTEKSLLQSEADKKLESKSNELRICKSNLDSKEKELDNLQSLLGAEQEKYQKCEEERNRLLHENEELRNRLSDHLSAAAPTKNRVR